MAIDLKKIIHTLQTGEAKSLPPVHLWQPEIVGEMDLCIDAQQKWFHEGEAFQRQSLVKLLASVMRKDGDDYFLVTPTEKMKIHVADVPFSIISLITPDDTSKPLVVVTNTEETIALDAHCQWQLRVFDEVELPYIKVRANLWARVSRPVFYQLVELADTIEDAVILHSAGHRFALGHV